MSWAELFERAADCSVTEAQVGEHLARHRQGQAEAGDEKGTNP